jgi:hypothetical protein
MKKLILSLAPLLLLSAPTLAQDSQPATSKPSTSQPASSQPALPKVDLKRVNKVIQELTKGLIPGTEFDDFSVQFDEKKTDFANQAVGINGSAVVKHTVWDTAKSSFRLDLNTDKHDIAGTTKYTQQIRIDVAAKTNSLKLIQYAAQKGLDSAPEQTDENDAKIVADLKAIIAAHNLEDVAASLKDVFTIADAIQKAKPDDFNPLSAFTVTYDEKAKEIRILARQPSPLDQKNFFGTSIDILFRNHDIVLGVQDASLKVVVDVTPVDKKDTDMGLILVAEQLNKVQNEDPDAVKEIRSGLSQLMGEVQELIVGKETKK